MAILPVVLIGILVLLFASIRIIKEYERGVVYTLGKYTGIREAGIQLVLPVIQQMQIVDIRVRTDDIPAQDLISKDNVSVRVSGVLNYRVTDPGLAINRSEDFLFRTNQLAQTTLRSILGQHDNIGNGYSPRLRRKSGTEKRTTQRH